MGTQSLEAFLAQPLVAHLATAGPTVTPIWFLWEDGAFWWLTGPGASWPRGCRPTRAPRSLSTAAIWPPARCFRRLHGAWPKSLLWTATAPCANWPSTSDQDQARWPQERFLAPLADPTSRLARLIPQQTPTLRDLSF